MINELNVFVKVFTDLGHFILVTPTPLLPHDMRSGAIFTKHLKKNLKMFTKCVSE